MKRISLIKKRLNDYFNPSELEVIDESHKHIGHAGAQNGAGHYTVKIKTPVLASLSKIEAHRRIYSVLSDLIPDEIHALSIVVG